MGAFLQTAFGRFEHVNGHAHKKHHKQRQRDERVNADARNAFEIIDKFHDSTGLFNSIQKLFYHHGRLALDVFAHALQISNQRNNFFVGRCVDFLAF